MNPINEGDRQETLKNLNDLLASERQLHEALDQAIQALAQGDDVVYRKTMLLIEMSRAFGQIDGLAMFIQTLDVQKVYDNITEEISAINEKMTRLNRLA
jgi:bacterioferritin (cytochrome b1)